MTCLGSANDLTLKTSIIQKGIRNVKWKYECFSLPLSTQNKIPPTAGVKFSLLASARSWSSDWHSRLWTCVLEPQQPLRCWDSGSVCSAPGTYSLGARQVAIRRQLADRPSLRSPPLSLTPPNYRPAPVHHSVAAFAVTSPRRLDSFTHCNTMQYCWKLQRSSAVSVHSTSVRIAPLENLVLSV